MLCVNTIQQQQQLKALGQLIISSQHILLIPTLAYNIESRPDQENSVIQYRSDFRTSLFSPCALSCFSVFLALGLNKSKENHSIHLLIYFWQLLLYSSSTHFCFAQYPDKIESKEVSLHLAWDLPQLLQLIPNYLSNLHIHFMHH